MIRSFIAGIILILVALALVAYIPRWRGVIEVISWLLAIAGIVLLYSSIRKWRMTDPRS